MAQASATRTPFATATPTDVQPDSLHANEAGHAKVAQTFVSALANWTGRTPDAVGPRNSI